MRETENRDTESVCQCDGVCARELVRACVRAILTCACVVRYVSVHSCTCMRVHVTERDVHVVRFVSVHSCTCMRVSACH